MPPSVDKCHLRAPCVHARHPLRGQAAAFLFRVHKNTPIRGQVLPPGTVRPRQAPSVWTGGCISLPRPQKHPHPWTKVTSRHRTSTPGTICVDKCYLRAPGTSVVTESLHSVTNAIQDIPFVTESTQSVTNTTSDIPFVTKSPHPVTNAIPGHPFSAKYANRKGSCFQKPFL